MTRVCLEALFAHWRRNPLQLFTFLAGLALATALWSGVQAINSEARASYDAAAATLGEGQFDQIVAKDGGAILQETYIALRRAGWQVSPVIEGRLGEVRLLGIEPLTAPQGFGPAARDTGAMTFEFLQPGVLFANAETAALLDVPVRIERDPDVAPGIALGDVGLVQRLLDRSDLSRLIVLDVQPLGRADLGDVAPDLDLRPSSQQSDIGALTDSFHLNLTAFGLLSFAVGLFIVHSAIGLAFEQRRGMIRTLRAIGVPLSALVRLMLLEMLVLALIGGAMGVLLGYVIAGLLLPDVAASLRGLYGAQVSGSLQFRAEWWLAGLCIAVLGTLAATIGRLSQVARMPLLASARPRAWAMVGQDLSRWQLGLAMTCLGAAVMLGLFGTGLVAGFVLQGCLMVGAALALPPLIGLALRLVEARTDRPVAQWFWADTRQQMPGLSLALMALLLAISANIGVSTMVSSFRLTFVTFLDQRLAPEVFVRVSEPEDAAKIESYLDGQEILPLRRVPGEVAGLPVQIYGARVGPTYRDNWRFLQATADAWDRVAAGQGVVVNEQLARRADLWPGDMVPVAANLVLPVVAVVGDYGNPIGQVILGEAVFQAQFPNAIALQFGLRTDDPVGMRAALERDLGLAPSAIIDQAAIKAASLRVFERTFAVTGALNVLTLGIAGFAMLMSLLTLADLRVPQLAPVWALGLTRHGLARLEILRALALATLVWVLALPLGLALAAALLGIVNVEAFGWRLPMFVFPGQYAWLLLYTWLAACLAALWPAWRLMRMPPARLLKVFAHER